MHLSPLYTDICRIKASAWRYVVVPKHELTSAGGPDKCYSTTAQLTKGEHSVWILVDARETSVLWGAAAWPHDSHMRENVHETCGHSVICTHCHLENLDITSSLCLALDQLVQTLECPRLDETHGLPLCAQGVLTVYLLHETKYSVLDCS